MKILLTGVGYYAPEEVISNQELVASFNQYVQNFNAENEQAIAEGKIEPLRESSEEFIVNASGIKNRHVINKTGILDPNIMHPILRERENEEISIQAEYALNAAKLALQAANKNPNDIDILILASSNFQRPYPALSVEIQAALGCKGYAFDMNMGCASAVFGIQTAANALKAQTGKIALVINAEITTAHLNFRDRDSHFIFGDACTAVVLETEDTATSKDQFEILDIQLLTQYSSNVRNNFGFLNITSPETRDAKDKLFIQNGRQVFKEVTPLAAKFISEQISKNHLQSTNIKRFWLHQANIKMNEYIMQKILGADTSFERAPIILDEYGNTAAAGSLICFAKYHEDFKKGDVGLLSAFGAGYSIGSMLIQKI